jgi:hypothetical protein
MRKWLWPERFSDKTVAVIGVWMIVATVAAAVRSDWHQAQFYAVFAAFDVLLVFLLARKRSQMERPALGEPP